MSDVITFLVVFVCSPNYISNPYLVAKIVEVSIFKTCSVFRRCVCPKISFRFILKEPPLLK